MAVAESPNNVTTNRSIAIKALDDAAIKVTLHVHNDDVLAAFVALADIVEPALKLAATVERHQLPVSGAWTHEFSVNKGWGGWIDEDVKKGAYDGFLGALIELVQVVEKDKEEA